MRPGDLVGQTLGHYRIKRQIGYGGMAAVFLAEDIHLSREIALKIFWPRSGETQDFLRRFAREARVLAQLDHPNILQIYDYGEEDELAYLVTPYMSGGTLKEVLRERKALPPSEATQLLSQVLPALQYAHDHNLVHRDIKPGNLLFKGDGSLVLADFGLVKVVEGRGTPLHTLSQTGHSIAGTPEYMAPEQIEGRAVAASDIYSMGIVLYEMVTGQRPFSGDSLLSILMKHVNEKPRPPRELNPYVSPQLEAAIQKAMAKEPRQRFACPADFLQALQQVGNPSSNPGLVSTRSNPASTPGIAGLASDSGIPNQHAIQNERDPGFTMGWTQAPTSASGPGMQSSDPGFNQSGSVPQNTPVFAQPVANSWQQGPVALPQVGSVPITLLPFAQAGGISQRVPPSLTPAPLSTRPRRSRMPVVALGILFVLIMGLVASLFLTPIGSLLGLRGPATRTPVVQGGTPGTGGGHSLTPGATQTLSRMLISCPTNGQARPAVMAPFTHGSDPTLVYIVNESDAGGKPTFGTVKIFNTATGRKTELAKTNRTSVTEAQVSNDGEWVLFVATVSGQSELRLVRLDGQGLQTLLCAPSGMDIRDSQWSINQKYVIFDEFPSNGGYPTVYLLNILTGALQVAITAPSSGIALIPRTWLDDHRVLMVGMVPDSDAPPQNIYLFDVDKGANQSIAGVQQVFTYAQPCWGFDSSYNARELFIAQCTLAQPTGSSTIIRQSLNGGSPTTLLTSPTLAFNAVRDIDRRDANLLALASDTGPGVPGGDSAHDGLYLVKSDGSAAPLRVASTPSGQVSELNAYSQYFWANVSRDETFYALETVAPASQVYTLSYGPLSGGTPISIASIGGGTTLAVAGWTTI